MTGDLAAQLADLLRRYAQLELPHEFDEAALASLVQQRQEIIEQIEQLDGEQTVLRQVIAKSPDVRELLEKIAELDRNLLDRAVERRDALQAALAKTAKGRQATQGYRMNLPQSSAFINKNI
jgi:ATPase subunit of ABC transporter with duplicated ATPase domains